MWGNPDLGLVKERSAPWAKAQPSATRPKGNGPKRPYLPPSTPNHAPGLPAYAMQIRNPEAQLNDSIVFAASASAALAGDESSRLSSATGAGADLGNQQQLVFVFDKPLHLGHENNISSTFKAEGKVQCLQ